MTRRELKQGRSKGLAQLVWLTIQQGIDKGFTLSLSQVEANVTKLAL
jgi:hypothetical protein